MITKSEYEALKVIFDRIGKRFAAEAKNKGEVNIPALIAKYFDVPTNVRGTHTKVFSSTDLQAFFQSKEGLIIPAIKIGRAIKAMGYFEDLRKVEGKTKRGYSVLVKPYTGKVK